MESEVHVTIPLETWAHNLPLVNTVYATLPGLSRT